MVPGTGNHKGCPYNRFAGAYFHINDGVEVVWFDLHSNDGFAEVPEGD